MKRKLIITLMLMATVAFVPACGGKESKVPEAGTTSTPEDAEPEETEETTGSFKDNVLETNKVKIVITDYKVIPVGEAGNEYGEKPVIAFWYDTTNLSGEDINPDTAWMNYFSAVQDNNENAVNDLEVGSLPDEQFLDTQLETIKKGGTVSNAIAYELDDEVTPVDLTAKELISLDDTTYGTQRFDLK